MMSDSSTLRRTRVSSWSDGVIGIDTIATSASLKVYNGPVKHEHFRYTTRRVRETRVKYFFRINTLQFAHTTFGILVISDVCEKLVNLVGIELFRCMS